MPRSAQPDSSFAAALADIAHGSHICAFYETQDDLFELVLPFFLGGLERNELCVWMTPDGIREDEARRRVGETFTRSDLEIRPGRTVYFSGGRFRPDKIARFWDERLQRALGMHRVGLRASGQAFWLQSNQWQGFIDCEADLAAMVAHKPISILCTYPLTISKSGDIYDVVRVHQVALAKRRHAWEVVVAPYVVQDKWAEAADATVRVSLLSPREHQVLDAIIDGRPNKVIAEQLGISMRTVEAHRTRLMHRLGVRNIVEAVRLGVLARMAPQSALPLAKAAAAQQARP